MQESTYKIYNASAGSGKTYTLTKAYLKIILSNSSNTSFRHILAITFTNKAVNEMKNRILDSLFEFGRITNFENVPPMLLEISKELDVDIKTLGKRSKLTLKYILHNYAFFDVSTIDKFTHRLIRTFAKDLKLPQNFEVVLDTDILLEEAISRLIYMIGEDKRLTQILLDFAFEKIDDNKSWDITFDLFKIGRLLFDENHAPHLKKLENKNIDDFLKLKNLLQEKIQFIEKNIVGKAKNCLEIIQNEGFETTDFPRETLPNHFKKIIGGEFSPSNIYNNKLEENLLDGKILLAKIDKKSETLAPKLLEQYLQIKELIYDRAFLINTYQNIVPLTVLNAIQQEIKSLEQEQDLLPISDFNRLIADEIKNQPAPFIYERLGEKYRHYFIDEFQDTSEMQWNNLIPLIGNALESLDEQGQKGSLLLVGDAKQAIYRWRGGKAEQFLDLSGRNKNPFVVEPEIELLPTNYRSHEEIVNFNNSFFQKISPFLNNGLYNSLFQNGSQQKAYLKTGGYVKLMFVEEDEQKTEDELYCELVLSSIQEFISKNYALNDICILTRKKKHGILVADFLMQNDIPIVSSETLLLKNNPKVKFLINLLKYCLDPSDLDTGYNILSFIGVDQNEKHSFVEQNLYNLNIFLKDHYGFPVDTLNYVSVYDGIEIAIKQFNLIEGSDAYVTFLTDFVHEVEQKEGGSLPIFLDNWDKKKDKLSITTPENGNAIQIMTVHKSKGLEFPIVIFPYVNTNIYEEIDPKLWLPVDAENYFGFNEVLISKKKEILEYSKEAETLFNKEEHKLELDAFNLLYVAMTRAIQNLYIITKKDLTRNGEHKPNYYSGIFIHYLKEKGLWDINKSFYSFGSLETKIMDDDTTGPLNKINHLYTNKNRSSFKILTKSGMLWDTQREDAILKGTLLHHIMSMIQVVEDIEPVFNRLFKGGDIDSSEMNSLKRKVTSIVKHPQLSTYYEKGNIIKNEMDIITQKGVILRPDRVIIKEKKVTILDYKTGKSNPRYYEQLYRYSDALEDMGYSVENRIIVYSNEEIVTEFI